MVQGRMQDVNLLIASTAERDKNGKYTEKASAFMDEIANYIALFHTFMWATEKNQFKVLLTSSGLQRMLSRGVLTRPQYDTIRSLDMDRAQGIHNACMVWITNRCMVAMDDNILPNEPGLRTILFKKITGRIFVILLSLSFVLFYLFFWVLLIH